MSNVVAGRVRQFTSDFHQFVEPWYVSYLLLGVTAGGIVGIILPLGLKDIGSLAYVGTVMAAVGVGQLTAEVWGSIADRYHIQRLVFTSGAVAVGLAFAGFSVTSGIWPWLALAVLLGLGTSAANTVATLLIVEVHPEEQWDQRISWLQTFYNLGVVTGTFLASPLTRIAVSNVFAVAMLITAAGAAVGWRTTVFAGRLPRAAIARRSVSLRTLLLRHFSSGRHHVPHLQFSHPGPLRHIYSPAKDLFRGLSAAVQSIFGIFLLIWFLSNLGMAAVITLYPLLMRNLFEVGPATSSLVLAASSGLGLLVYSRAGALEHRVGAVRIFGSGLVMRLAGLGGLLVVALGTHGGRALPAVVAFGAVMLAAPLLTVSGTVMTSRLSQSSEGGGQGIFNACTALAGLSGSLLAGFVANWLGYRSLVLLAVVGAALALVLSFALQRGRDKEL